MNYLKVLVMRLDIDINEMIDDSVRASVLSLKSLLARFSGSVYLLLAGYMLELISFEFLMLFTGVMFAVSGLLYIKLYGKHKAHKVDLVENQLLSDEIVAG